MLVKGSIYTPRGIFLGHINIFLSRLLLVTIKYALTEHFPFSMSYLESGIQIVVIIASSDDEAREKLKVLKECKYMLFG